VAWDIHVKVEKGRVFTFGWDDNSMDTYAEYLGCLPFNRRHLSILYMDVDISVYCLSALREA
jgi:hypothetical protein